MGCLTSRPHTTVQVFSYLDLDSLSRASRVCSNWNRISNDNEVCFNSIYVRHSKNSQMWRDRWALRYGESDKRCDVGWKKLYRRSTLWSWSSVHCPPEVIISPPSSCTRFSSFIRWKWITIGGPFAMLVSNNRSQRPGRLASVIPHTAQESATMRSKSIDWVSHLST